MSWFDALILVLLVGVLLFEVRQEAGRALLDAAAALVALWASLSIAPAVTQHLKWRPAPEAAISPGAFALTFAVMLALCLLVSLAIHQRTRWSLEHYDLPFAAIFGLVLAVTLGHVVTDVTAQQALLNEGRVPPYLRQSVLAEELRSFHTYHYVVGTLGGLRSH